MLKIVTKMENIYSGCECDYCPDDWEVPSSEQEEGASNDRDSFDNKKQLRDEDAYQEFTRKVSTSHPDKRVPMDSASFSVRSHGYPDRTSKIQSYARPTQPIQQGVVTKRIPLIQEKEGNNGGGNVVGKNLIYFMEEGAERKMPLTLEEKKRLFEKMMSPWLKPKPKQMKMKFQAPEPNKKRKLTPIEKKQLKVKKTRKKFTDFTKIGNDIDDFLATATAADLQKYYRTIPSRTDSSPIMIPVDTFLRLPKLIIDLQRINELRKENLKLLFKINVIQRTTGRVDHINNCKPREGRLRTTLRYLRKVEKENLELYNTLQNTKGLLPTRTQLAEEWKVKIEKMREKAKFPLSIPGLVETENVIEDDQYRPKVFLEFGIENGNILGRVVISLFLESMPVTVTNFVALCENFQKNLENVDKIQPKTTKLRKTEDEVVIPHLAGSPIHRIFPNLYFEGGDIVNGRGSAGKAANGIDFYPENMDVPHNHEGTISMTINPDGRVNSLFAISFRPLDMLKGRRPAFGRVVKGLKLIQIIESYGTKNGKPKQKILIKSCGLIQPN